MGQFESIPKPPKWPGKILSKLLKQEYLEEILGDMEEEYFFHAQKYSIRKARFFYTRELIKVLRPNLLKRQTGTQKLNKIGMIANYSKIAFRNIKKHKVYSTVKIGGFSIGIAVCLLISLFVLEEFKVDQNQKEKPLYRVLTKSENPSNPYISPSLQPVFAPSVKQDYPEVVESGRILHFDGFGDAGGNLFRPEGEEISIYEERFAYADPSILKMFSFKMIHGSHKSLEEPFTLIISRSKAEKHFGKENPVGKAIFINENKKDFYQISGVFEDLENSYLKDLDFFLTLTGKEFWEGEQTSWCCNNYSTFIQLESIESEASFQSKLKSIHDAYITAYFLGSQPLYGKEIEEFNTLIIQPVSEIYLHSKEVYDFETVGDISLVRTFIIVTIFILLLACMNFINLATANSAQRSKEIALRKAVGSGRRGIIIQFLTEAMVIVFFSVIFGIFLALLFLPFFNQVVDKTINIPFSSPLFYFVLLLFIMVIGLVSGFYPAFYLSKTKTIEALKGNLKLKNFGANGLLRNGLVVFQFAVSMMLIAGALVVYKQMSFIFNKDLGYDKDQLLLVHGVGTMDKRLKTLKEKFINLEEVENATVSNSLPIGGTQRNGNSWWKAGRKSMDEAIPGQFWSADDDYVNTLGLEFISGRSFDLDRSSDSTSVVINEAMVEALGLKEPLSEKIENWMGEWKVVGVVKDFHFSHLRKEVRPLVITPYWEGDIITLKMNTDDMLEAIAKIEAIWKEFNPNQQIRLEFLDQQFAMMYEGVKRTRTIFLFFALFAVIVACLGLFGLSVYTVSIRSKEMTIRKVMGASMSTITRLLTVDYLKLIITGLIISIPVTWHLAEGWLNDFRYRIDSFWMVFIYSALLLIIIAMTVVSYQSIKSARSNPSIGLRSE